MVNKLKNLLFTKTGKDTSVVFLGTALNVIAGGLFFILVPRLLGPANYGLFSTLTATAVFAVSLANFGIDTGILKFAKKNSDQFNKYLSLGFFSYLFLGLLVSFVGILLSSQIAAFLGNPQIADLLRIAFASTLLLLLTNFYVAALQAKEKFAQASFINVISNLLRLLILVIAMLFIQVNLIFVTLLFFFVTLVSPALGMFLLPFKIEKIEKKDLVQFHNYNFWIASSLIIASFPLDNYFLVKLSGAAAAGVYAAPFKIFSFVYQFAGNFSRVLAPRFASFDTSKKAKDFGLKSFTFVGAFCLGLLTLILLANPVIKLLFGDAYLTSVPVFRILGVGFIFIFASTVPVSIIIYFLGSSKISFVLTAINVITFLILLLIFIPTGGAFGAGLAFALSEFIFFVLSSVYVLYKIYR